MSGSLTITSPQLPLRACTECDLISEIPRLSPGEAAHCPRCNHVMAQRHNKPATHVVAYALAALVALGISLPFTFISFEANGVLRQMGLTEAATTLLAEHYELLSLLIWSTIIVLPGLYLLISIYLHLGPLWGYTPLARRWLGRLLKRMQPWMMADVFLIGVLVSMVKVLALASIGFGTSFWAYVAFVVLMLKTSNVMDHDWLWTFIAGPDRPIRHAIAGRTGASQGMTGCTVCHAINDLGTGKKPRCRRCDERLHMRRPHSIQATMALLLTAVLLYIPAMLLPIMTVSTLGDRSPQTVIAGVLHLIGSGDWPIALIIFVASVVIPIAKIMALTWLCWKVYRPRPWRPHVRHRLYFMTEVIGRWSMIDVFVVALLVALVQLGAIMEVYPGAGVIAFASVVVITMMAAMRFDPRLLWDELSYQQDPSHEQVSSSGEA
ncbi:paraquat-inducible protein A [Larsenimonas rhizosphaerae]|uniref:Paraquat-inducible protein A n=1 Tax=Larsenimonas rhizosphaerae TaxID=2944682 RepID=A0AA41ZFQ4_9GAMM|nr:paraquat-inducible protein A [Larsenimonas rhizosphaerae]MCX2523947.1 paraquat-inducible protein A [Larsenimonas rhizosphaerae]